MEALLALYRRHSLFKDLSLSAVNAGFVTVLVGFTSSAVIIMTAAQALGATPEGVGSWMWALGLGMGVTCIGLSLRYRIPLATAWSTAGAAMLISSAGSVTMAQAIGAFLFSGALITVPVFRACSSARLVAFPCRLHRACCLACC